jgi:hypothetical protein
MTKVPITMYQLRNRVARWFVFKPKIPIWENSGDPYMGENVAIFYGHLENLTDIWNSLHDLVYLVFIWYIFASFGIMHQ